MTAGEGRGASRDGSFARLKHFAIDQPSRVFLALAGFRACLIAGRRQRRCGLFCIAAGC